MINCNRTALGLLQVLTETLVILNIIALTLQAHAPEASVMAESGNM